MPKIIKDIENIIRNSAKELFVEKSYDDVDMRMIAKRSGIAVGTLYNYYENKKQLYLSILYESWQDTFNKLDAINNLNSPPGEKLRELIYTLYEDIEARNGLGKALINTSSAELMDDEEVNALKNDLISRFESFFSCHDKSDTLGRIPGIDTKLTESLLINTLAMHELHPNDKKENIDFLVGFVCLSIK